MLNRNLKSGLQCCHGNFFLANAQPKKIPMLSRPQQRFQMCIELARAAVDQRTEVFLGSVREQLLSPHSTVCVERKLRPGTRSKTKGRWASSCR